MRAKWILLLLAVAGPLTAQGAGTDSCNLGQGFQCDQYVVRTGPDSQPRRVAKVIAVWRSDHRAFDTPLDTAGLRASTAEYRRRVRAAEDAERVFMGGSSGDAIFALTISRRPPRGRFIFGTPDSAFVAGRAFRIPDGDTAVVLLISGPERIDEPSPTVTSLHTVGVLPPSGARQWRRGDTTFIVRPPRDAPNLPVGFTELPAVAAFLRGEP